MARFKRSKKTGQTERAPDGQIRQSQLLGAYGAGSMIDLVQHAVLVQGLDSWHYRGDEADHFIEEPRLKARLDSRYKMKLGSEYYFRLAPAGDDDSPTQAKGIRALEFPGWFVCQGCRRLIPRKLLGEPTRADGRRLHGDCRSKNRTLVPIRFVAACTHGHLQDFPWVDLAHFGEDNKPCDYPEIYLYEGKYGDFNDIKIECKACSAPRRQLADARSKHVKFICHANRPWLPFEHTTDPNGCSDKDGLRLLVRTASNGYFSMQLSALSIDEPEREVANALEPKAANLRKAIDAGDDAAKMWLTIELGDVVKAHGIDEVLAEAKKLAKGEKAEPVAIRRAEYEQLTTAAPLEETGKSFNETDKFVARRITPEKDIPGVRTVTLVHRLREVVVQFGFTRLEPVSADVNGEYDDVDLDVKRAPLSAREDWLPAATLQGEGVFFELDPAALDEWLKRPAVKARAEVLEGGWKRWHKDRGVDKSKKPPEFLGIRYYLLHSLSHLLINSIAMECGYAASSIKERIYAPGEEVAGDAAGVLLYTGTVGSEGTLGGLVAEGRRLGHHMRRAFETASLCSNDPLCGTHDPQNDPSDRLLHGAACHGCLLIAETCCDRRFNRCLDRALVVPVIGQEPTLAFFDPADFGPSFT